MRILAIDAGNTRIKWGLHENGSWRVQGSGETARASALGRAWSKLGRADAVIAANVAGARVARELERAARGLGRLRMVRAAARACGIVNSYHAPSRLGADRWAALIGARGLHRGAALVVSAGTTLTADALSADGVFLGGIIVAGPELMRGALGRRTAQLRPRGGRFAYFPAGTADAIESGAINALAGAVERMLRFMREAGEPDPVVMLSGGLAARLAPRLNVPLELVDNLVLEGLVRIVLERRRKP